VTLFQDYVLFIMSVLSHDDKDLEIASSPVSAGMTVVRMQMYVVEKVVVRVTLYCQTRNESFCSTN
jgi:hypothetical protein